ncbi:UvrD-helicase domain-containing protein, partial [Pelosinus sp. HCF1]
MPDTPNLNPAEIAAQESISQMIHCITQRNSFILEAGAGAGKTYSLIRALRFLIETKERELLRRNQKIACITYTNVARDEIEARTDRNPVVLSATIHAFCWSLIKDFQPALRCMLPQIGRWAERLVEHDDISRFSIEYDLGYPKINESEILLAHDDILPLTVMFMSYPKFRAIVTNRYPILFIDEYQDTDSAFVEALKRHFLDTGEGPFIGFFGDHWQKIYGNGCGKIEHEALTVIEKRANFRSVRTVVECLNRMRTELTQEVSDPEEEGFVSIFHTNDWVGERRTGAHWAGDLPVEEAHSALSIIKTRLSEQGWDFSPDNSKILMLTHNVLAEEQGYKNLAAVFSRTESYIKKEDPYIAYFAEILEPVCKAYENRRFGEMFAAVSTRTS